MPKKSLDKNKPVLRILTKINQEAQMLQTNSNTLFNQVVDPARVLFCTSAYFYFWWCEPVAVSSTREVKP
jgi:hypothetical protein